MNTKVRIYRDTGADIKFLRPYRDSIIYYQYPYDSSDRPKKEKPVLAKPSGLQRQDANTTWEEEDSTWQESEPCEIQNKITDIVGRGNSEDIKHLGSAYKERVHIFITSDKGDIWSKRLLLEALCGFKIFYHHDREAIKQYVEGLLKPDKAMNNQDAEFNAEHTI